jgi:hypothetical protein
MIGGSMPTLTSMKNWRILETQGFFSARQKRITYGTAAPTSETWAVGDLCYNTTPAAAGYVGWVCVTAGTPGTWKGFGVIQS